MDVGIRWIHNRVRDLFERNGTRGSIEGFFGFDNDERNRLAIDLETAFGRPISDEELEGLQVKVRELQLDGLIAYSAEGVAKHIHRGLEATYSPDDFERDTGLPAKAGYSHLLGLGARHAVLQEPFEYKGEPRCRYEQMQFEQAGDSVLWKRISPEGKLAEKSNKDFKIHLYVPQGSARVFPY